MAAGLFKKVVISSYVESAIVDPVFSAPHQHSALEILFAIYGYAVQIYADFSGYTDIAIGLALFLGFRFPDNFDAPYTAPQPPGLLASLAHDPVPLAARLPLHPARGRPRLDAGSIARNIMITMVLGGLWHGAAWTFVAWGAHPRVRPGRGPSAAGHAGWRPASTPCPAARLRVVVQRLVTFHIVCLGWVFFRADSFSTATTLLGRLFTAWGPRPAGDAARGDHHRGHRGAAVPAHRPRRPRPERIRPVNGGWCKGPYWGPCFSGSRHSGPRASHRSSTTGSRSRSEVRRSGPVRDRGPVPSMQLHRPTT